MGPPPSTSAAPPYGRRYWLATGLAATLAATYATTSAGKLADSHHFDAYGYPPWLCVAVGLLEALGAIAWAVPRLRGVAPVLTGPVMAGAIWTHVRRGELAMALVPASLLALQLAHVRLAGWMRPERRAARREPSLRAAL